MFDNVYVCKFFYNASTDLCCSLALVYYAKRIATTLVDPNPVAILTGVHPIGIGKILHTLSLRKVYIANRLNLREFLIALLAIL